MRALLTCYPAFGHFLPLTPIARAMLEAGHDVRFATPSFFRPAVEAAGYHWLRAGVENDDAEMVALLADQGLLHGAERVRFTLEYLRAGIQPRRLVPDLIAIADQSGRVSNVMTNRYVASIPEFMHR